MNQQTNQQSKEATKQKDPESWRIDWSYEERLKDLREQKLKATKGKKLLKGKEIPWVIDRQAIKRPYANGSQIGGLALETMRIFVQEIHTHSGRHVHQGGLVLFVLKGRGYTVVDGVKNSWGEGDLIILPIKQGGVEHQHFNVDDKPSRWLALRNTALEVFTGCILEQKEDHPAWKKLSKTP